MAEPKLMPEVPVNEPQEQQAPQPQEAVPAPEKQVESQQPQQAEQSKESSEPVTIAPQSAAPAQSAPVAAPETQKSETLQKIEDIMQEDMVEVYQGLSDEKKKEFKEKGEEAAHEIETMMYKVKVNSKKVFKLIFGWLKVVPGLNKYFLQQEAKLKTDELMHIKEELDKSRTFKS